MWLVLGSAAIITAVLNLIFWKQGKETGCYRFASISLTALTMCAFYSDSAGRVRVGRINGYHAGHVESVMGMCHRIDTD